MLTVLVTGGTGYIGSHTVVELLNNNYSVVVVDNFSNSKPEVIKSIESITGKSFVFYKGDIRDSKLLFSVFEQNKIDGVIHLAGLKAVGESIEQPLEYYENNINSTFKLLYAMKQHNVNNLVFSSSATVYGANTPIPYSENFPAIRSDSPYGTTKTVQEWILDDIVKAKEFGLKVLSLRYFNPIGADSSGLIGDDPFQAPNNLVPYIMRVAQGKLPFLQIFGDDYSTSDGTCIRDYIHISDLSIAHLKAMQFLLEIKESYFHDAINIGTGIGTSVFELHSAFEKYLGKTIPYQVKARRLGDLERFYADPTKAKTVLNWTSNYTIDDMVKSTLHFGGLI
jgi:UDP-glucose 4-epimerase